MKLWLMLFAGLVVAVPAGAVTADFDTLDNSASPTQTADRIQNATPVAEPPPPSVAPESFQILMLVNDVRASRGLVPMRLNSALNDAAQGHSATQAAAGSIFHVTPSGSNPGDRIARTGYQFSTWGENVAAGYRNAQTVMDAWMRSPGHCRNILNPGFTELGVGYVQREGDPSRYFDYWTQVFARPQGEPLPPGTYNAAWC
jgi:uncharacterized protein YkwD